MARMNKDQQDLITDNYKLLSNFLDEAIVKYNIPFYKKDEFISISNLKFCISALKYDKYYGCKFSTFAYGGFKFGLRYLFREENNHNYPLRNNLESKKEFDKYCLYFLIKKSKLKEKYINILIDIYLHNIPVNVISDKYHMTRQGIWVAVTRSLDKIRRVAEIEDLQINDFYKE